MSQRSNARSGCAAPRIFVKLVALVAWHGVLGQLEAVARCDPRPQRRRAITARAELARLRDELKRSQGARTDELRRTVEDAEVVEREAWLAALVTVHRDATPEIDWRAVAALPPPLMPAVDQTRSNEARRRLLDYRPDTYALVDRRSALVAEVERLVAAEEAERSAIMGTWRAQMAGWSAWCSATARVLCGDLAAYREVLDASGGLDELHETLDREAVRIELSATTAEVELELRVRRAVELGARGGEAAVEYGRGAPLRIARELLAVLPIASVRLHGRSIPSFELSRARAATIDWERATTRAVLDELGATNVG